MEGLDCFGGLKKRLVTCDEATHVERPSKEESKCDGGSNHFLDVRSDNGELGHEP